MFKVRSGTTESERRLQVSRPALADTGEFGESYALQTRL